MSAYQGKGVSALCKPLHKDEICCENELRDVTFHGFLECQFIRGTTLTSTVASDQATILAEVEINRTGLGIVMGDRAKPTTRLTVVRVRGVAQQLSRFRFFLPPLRLPPPPLRPPRLPPCLGIVFLLFQIYKHHLEI